MCVQFLYVFSLQCILMFKNIVYCFLVIVKFFMIKLGLNMQCLVRIQGIKYVCFDLCKVIIEVLDRFFLKENDFFLNIEVFDFDGYFYNFYYCISRNMSICFMFSYIEFEYSVVFL